MTSEIHADVFSFSQQSTVHTCAVFGLQQTVSSHVFIKKVWNTGTSFSFMHLLSSFHWCKKKGSEEHVKRVGKNPLQNYVKSLFSDSIDLTPFIIDESVFSWGERNKNLLLKYITRACGDLRPEAHQAVTHIRSARERIARRGEVGPECHNHVLGVWCQRAHVTNTRAAEPVKFQRKLGFDGWGISRANLSFMENKFQLPWPSDPKVAGVFHLNPVVTLPLGVCVDSKLVKLIETKLHFAVTGCLRKNATFKPEYDKERQKRKTCFLCSQTKPLTRTMKLPHRSSLCAFVCTYADPPVALLVFGVNIGVPWGTDGLWLATTAQSDGSSTSWEQEKCGK